MRGYLQGGECRHVTLGVSGYLRPSIKRFPTGREQVALARAAGFNTTVHYEVGFGLMGVLVARKGPAL